MTEDSGGYVLGSTRQERQRLDVQSEYYRPATEDALRRVVSGPACGSSKSAPAPEG